MLPLCAQLSQKREAHVNASELVCSAQDLPPRRPFAPCKERNPALSGQRMSRMSPLCLVTLVYKVFSLAPLFGAPFSLLDCMLLGLWMLNGSLLDQSLCKTSTAKTWSAGRVVGAPRQGVGAPPFLPCGLPGAGSWDPPRRGLDRTMEWKDGCIRGRTVRRPRRERTVEIYSARFAGKGEKGKPRPSNGIGARLLRRVGARRNFQLGHGRKKDFLECPVRVFHLAVRSYILLQ